MIPAHFAPVLEVVVLVGLLMLFLRIIRRPASLIFDFDAPRPAFQNVLIAVAMSLVALIPARPMVRRLAAWMIAR
jgi:hypothetical protein